MNVFGLTDMGKVRQTNQDSFKIVQMDDLYLLVVCDGMGGANGGKTASSNAVDAFVCSAAIKIDAAGGDKDKYEKALRDAVADANKKVYEMSGESADLAGMGTTLCAALTDSERIWAVSVGDSRIYKFVRGRINQISHDHSYVQALLDSGSITVAESKNHPNKNIITRAVGTQEEVECDSFLMKFDMDGLLLCSDGLTNFVSDSELNKIFKQNNSAEDTAKAYIDAANAAGGGDNITAIVIKK